MILTFDWRTPRIALIRLHDADAAVLGDPFVWSAVVEIQQDGAAKIMGVDKPLPPGGARALCQGLCAAGFTHRSHDRIRDGRTRTVFKAL